MGCDIHLYKEKKVNGKWVTADEWAPCDDGDDDKGIEVPWENRFTGRNYELFGLLSKGVRREHPFSIEARGLPADASPEVREESEGWGVDGHSHSHLTLQELKDLHETVKAGKILIKGMKSASELAELKESIANGSPDWNKLFPYCGWTNIPGHVEFELDVPADFYVGESLKEIIDSFNGIDGDDHRIVFFFDN